jgi:hypothetical protein
VTTQTSVDERVVVEGASPDAQEANEERYAMFDARGSAES